MRKKGIIKSLGPDGKSQVTVEYHDGKPNRLEAVVIAQQRRAVTTRPPSRKDDAAPRR